MKYNDNRLRFVHCDHLFDNIDEIKEYVRSIQYEHASLYAEPSVYKYGDEKNPNIVLAIGSVGNGVFEYDADTGEAVNKTFFIDFSHLETSLDELYKIVEGDEKKIAAIDDVVKELIQSCGVNEDGTYVPNVDDKILSAATSFAKADEILSTYIVALEKKQNLLVEETPTISFDLSKKESGTTLSGNVKLGSFIADGKVVKNILSEKEDGLFANVDLEYDNERNSITFTINSNENGEITKVYELPNVDNIASGEYDPYTEQIILTTEKGVEIPISVAKLIEEWTVEGEDSATPIVLEKVHVKANDKEHDGDYDYQDILKADIRILSKDKKPNNILEKDSSGKYLFVDGSATNIKCTVNGEEKTLQEAINGTLHKGDISSSETNIVTLRTDGLYSYVDISYDSAKNKIIFKKSNIDGTIQTSEYELNTAQLIQKAYYDSTTEEVVIAYINAKNEYQELRVPLHIIVNEFSVDNTNATVTLTIVNNPQGKDTIKGDVNLSTKADNILENIGHSLYVGGTADNIKMIDTTLGSNVESSISNLSKKATQLAAEEANARAEAINDILSKLNAEIERAKNGEHAVEDLVDAEKTRAVAAENALANSIANEQTRAENKEAQLENSYENVDAKVENEVSRATTAEGELRTSISNEIDRAKIAEEANATAISTETTRATSAETEIQSNLYTEIARAKNAETAIEQKVDTNTASITTINSTISSLRTNLETEKDRAAAKEVEIENNLSSVDTKLDNEISRAKEAEESIKESITLNGGTISDLNNKITTVSDNLEVEKDRAIAKETEIANNLSAEIARAKSEEEAIKNSINLNGGTISDLNNSISSVANDLQTEKDRAIAKDTEIANNVSSLNTKLDNEITRATSQENDIKVNVSANTSNIASLQSELETEKDRAIAKETELSQNIDIVNLSLSNEVDRAKAEESSIRTVIDSNTTLITSLDGKIQIVNRSVEAETTRAMSAETELNTAITNVDTKLTNEVSRAKTEEAAIRESVSANSNSISDLASDVQTVSKNIENEVSRATAKEAELSATINNNDLKLDNEISRATTAENELSNRISDEVSRATSADTELARSVSNEISRATNKENEISEALTTETSRAKTEEQLLAKDIATLSASYSENSETLSALTDSINNVIKTYAMSIQDTSTVDLTKEVIENGGFILSADVKVSPESGNTLVKLDNGLYSNIILTYSQSNNTLHFTANGVTNDIPLLSVSTIEKIIYDPDTNNLVMSYIANGELQDVSFPASGVFKPIVTNNDGNNVIVNSITNSSGASEVSANLYFKDNIDNDNTPVVLYATSDNKLKASLNVANSSGAANNILEITSDGSSVWVNGIATNIAMAVNRLGSGSDSDPYIEAQNTEDAIHIIDDRLMLLRKQVEDYDFEGMQEEVTNLKEKTEISAISTSTIELSYKSTNKSSSLQADVKLSSEPINLLKDDNGLIYDGNVDYLFFENEDFDRHLQLKRDNDIFASVSDALSLLTSYDFLKTKNDGEPVIARYHNGDEVAFIFGVVRVINGKKTMLTINNKGSIIDRFEYYPHETAITTTDVYGYETVTNVGERSIYLEYTDASSLKHAMSVSLIPLMGQVSVSNENDMLSVDEKGDFILSNTWDCGTFEFIEETEESGSTETSGGTEVVDESGTTSGSTEEVTNP